MNITRAYKLPIHNHPLFPSSMFRYVECDGCHVKEPIYGGYICNELNCYGWFHKECAGAPPEINHHPSHSEHPLLLTNDSQTKDSPCDCCGKNLLSPCYTCPTCEFKVDLICGMKPSPPAIEHPMCHDHSLVFLKKREVEVPCEACKESIGGPSYSCLECHNVYFHLDCVHLQKEVNHPYHPSHPLKVVAFELLADNQDAEKSLDFICGIKPSPSAIEHPVCHDHQLVFLKKGREEEVHCEVCKKSISGPSYSCPECNNVYFHLDCVHLSKEVNHPCHSNHPLKIIAYESLRNDDHAEKDCRLCSTRPEEMLCHCSTCNFTLCLRCTKLPPPLVVDHSKTHTHTLRLVSSKLSFTCKVCGIDGYRIMPYICLECDFVIHGGCIGFPHVININRHDHRISFTYHHDRGGRCGVCRTNVSQYYGAYSCSVCPNYTVHTRCAINNTTWNFAELEGTHEKIEDIAPFKVVEHNLIRHFSHSEHTLRLLKDIVNIHDVYECIRCEACFRLVEFGPVYSCTECYFSLHEKCANLPMEKRLFFDPAPYTLRYDKTIIYCNLCGMLNDGFRYTSQGIRMQYHYVDVHCASLSEPLLVHNLHLHPLYFLKTNDNYCDACKRARADYMLACDTCNFSLCLYCATLPEGIRHMSDEHPLTLYCGGKGNGKNWCDVCEVELDPSKWFFACSDCEVALHVQCALGDFSRLMPGKLYTFGERECEVVLNNLYTRPFCSHCRSRCKAPVIFKDNGEDNRYMCSLSCLSSYLCIHFGPPQFTEI
ncbi:unnamed protein product [Brassica oleracea var. botrytis]